MKIYRGMKELGANTAGVTLTIGNFDGMHLGHQRLVTQLLDKARQLNTLSYVMTFDPHPSEVLSSRPPVRRIFPQSDLENYLSDMGVSALVIEPFTVELSKLSGEAFFRQLILPAFKPKAVVVGHDFVFGHKKSGTFELLQNLGTEFSFDVERVDAFVMKGLVVSSTLIRKYLAAGDVEKAEAFLGRPFYFSARIIKGEGRGEKMGIPTANMAAADEFLPAAGVYLTHFEIDGSQYPSLTNIGHKPTFHKDYELGVETFVMNFDGETLGKSAKVTFHKRLRDEIKFPNKEALILQINEDIESAKRYFKM